METPRPSPAGSPAPADEAAVNRRGFLRDTASVAGALGAAQLLRPRPAHAQPMGANDRLQFAVIGCGGKGNDHVNSIVKRQDEDNVRVAAVCDVYQRVLANSRQTAQCDAYSDYRRVLDRRDIDGVLIATPDHWHAKIAIEALESGKHVFVEKPMTHTIEQAIALRDTVRRTKLQLQVGPQATSQDVYWQAHDVIAKGRVGKPTWAQASYNRNHRACLYNSIFPVNPHVGPERPGEDNVDWDMWLGHEWGLAPKIPWNPDHFHRFRKYWAYNGGVATDLLYHKLAPMLIALMGANGEYPTRVSTSGGLYVEKDDREIPDVFLTTIDYPSEVTVLLVSVLTNDTQLPDRIYCKQGTVDLDDRVRLKMNGEFEQEFRKANDNQTEIAMPVNGLRDMFGNLLDGIRKGDRLHCNVELGAATMVAIKMGVESYRQRKMLTWDAEAERVVS